MLFKQTNRATLLIANIAALLVRIFAVIFSFRFGVLVFSFRFILFFIFFAGTRVPIKNLFDYLEGSESIEDFLEGFPPVTREQAVAVLEMAEKSLIKEVGAN